MSVWRDDKRISPFWEKATFSQSGLAISADHVTYFWFSYSSYLAFKNSVLEQFWSETVILNWISTTASRWIGPKPSVKVLDWTFFNNFAAISSYLWQKSDRRSSRISKRPLFHFDAFYLYHFPTFFQSISFQCTGHSTHKMKPAFPIVLFICRILTGKVENTSDKMRQNDIEGVPFVQKFVIGADGKGILEEF